MSVNLEQVWYNDVVEVVEASALFKLPSLNDLCYNSCAPFAFSPTTSTVTALQGERFVMYDRLIFHGYASRDLDLIAEKFKEQHGKKAPAFVIQNGYVVSGSKENHDKIVRSRFGGANAVYVPIYLTRDQIVNLDATRNERQPHYDNSQKTIWQIAENRYCIFCKSLLEFAINDPRDYCDKQSCIDAHETKQAEQAETKEKLKSEAKPAAPKQKESKPKAEKKLDPIVIPWDEFSLDDPYTSTIDGYVYLIESENGLFKIGRSKDVWKRFSSIAMAVPVPITLRHVVPTINYIRAEEWLHEQFASKRHHGEWFQLDQDDLEWFKDLENGSLDNV